MFYTLEALADLIRSDANATLALVLKGVIPPPIILGGRLVRWRESALREWSAKGCPVTAALTADEALLLRKTRCDEQDEINAKWDADHPVGRMTFGSDPD